MKKIVVLLPLMMMLAACGEESKIKEVIRPGAIRNNPKDPGSVLFRDAVVSADAKRACIDWAGKDSKGQYFDWVTAELIKIDSQWTEKTMIGDKYNCSEVGFKGLDAYDKAKLEAKVIAIEMLQKARNISSEEATELPEPSELACSVLVSNFASSSGLVAKYRIHQDAELLALYEGELQKEKARLEKGQCVGEPVIEASPAP